MVLDLRHSSPTPGSDREEMGKAYLGREGRRGPSISLLVFGRRFLDGVCWLQIVLEAVRCQSAKWHVAVGFSRVAIGTCKKGLAEGGSTR